MSVNWPAIRHRVATTAAIAAVACGSLTVSSSVSAGTATEVDVMAWLDDVDPAITVDQSNKCMAGATDAVAYRNDRIVLRTSANDASVKTTVNTKLNLMYGGGPINYVGPIERITFPNTPPANTPVTPVLSVTLVPRPSGLPHDIVGLARRLRQESHVPSSPDYALTPEGPYGHYWPDGFPAKISTLTPPRTNLVPLTTNPIGTGVKVEIFDTGLAPTTASELPTTSKLASTDNELIDIVDNGPSMADYPAVAHGKAIAGTIYTTAPGATIQEVRINDRSGLLTDVSAVRGMASALRTLSRVDYPDLIVNSFSTAVCDAGPGSGVSDLRPVGLEAVVEVVDKFDPYQPDGMLIVASAGNLATRRPHYPAAFETVVGVGALDGNIGGDLSPWSSPARTAPIADFSDRGSWVDVYAPGVDIPTTHATGVRFQDGGDIIEGKANVSGTSFSAPIFTGYLAEIISTGKVKARTAYAQLVSSGRAALPQCGTAT
ncbi:MAG: S8/S53 family peptidase, partial [Ilumatobacteraceae bacterium]|nr:S8/S53 family peptidase [Ilumatobacteraceae bacterium]